MTVPIACLAIAAAAGGAEDPSRWTVYVTNDDCPDYTWGLTEEATRQAFADIVRAHLDEMAATDGQPPERRDRYNMAVAQEALCFLERYPDRKEELVRRVREGRVGVSPFLCNVLWGFASAEGVIRSLYPARRLEREWGIRLDVAEHIEQPSVPWGMAAILPACGIRWLQVAFLDYDSAFGGLRAPPLFVLEGPDGSRLRVALDAWASRAANYTQGAAVLRDPKAIEKVWIPHYAGLGEEYPIDFFLASGTHGDIGPASGGAAPGFARAIIDRDGGPGPRAKIVNSTLAMFCEAVDRAEEARPFLPALRGSLGDSWDLWPVSLARPAAAMRDGERMLLAAEALASVAAARDPAVGAATRADRERAERCLAMLSDHAWNGTDDGNRKVNAELRARWGGELTGRAEAVRRRAWSAFGLPRDEEAVAIFNPQGFARSDLVQVHLPADMMGARPEGTDGQVVEDGDGWTLAFVSPEVPATGFARIPLVEKVGEPAAPLRASPTELEGPHCRIRIDPASGGIASLVHRATGRELVAPGKRALGETVWFDGKERPLAGVRSDVAACGPVLARIRSAGEADGMRVTTLVTIFAALDRVDLEVRIRKPPRSVEERVTVAFPVVADGAVLRIESTGAIVRPRPRPEGDLLPGADPRRFAVQGFIDASLPAGPGVTIAPLEAFALRLDLDAPAFEVLGNDQNHKEVSRDQGGAADFVFRFSIRAHAGPFDPAAAVAWSRAVAGPLLAVPGKLPDGTDRLPAASVDPRRAVIACLKPADDDPGGSVVLRVWETAGREGPVAVAVRGFRKAARIDLLERDPGDLPISAAGTVDLPIRPRGFAALRLGEPGDGHRP